MYVVIYYLLIRESSAKLVETNSADPGLLPHYSQGCGNGNKALC